MQLHFVPVSPFALQFLQDATSLREMDGYLSNIIKSIEFMPL
jgi:hypothetical protein